MDNTEDHASIDIKNLATSLRKEFETLHSLSDECCIYRIPHNRRQLNVGLYNPKVVSIGPLHHGREGLKALEEFKKRYLQYFLQRTKVSMEEFLTFIKDRETRLRNCYAETIKLGSDDFMKMILLDSVFVIEFSLRAGIFDEWNISKDRIYTKPWMKHSLVDDMWLLENQLPLFILKDLFALAKREVHSKLYEGISMSKRTCELWEAAGHNLLIEYDLLEEHFPKAEHFVDLIRLCFQPSEIGMQNGELKTLVAPSITELHQAGDFEALNCEPTYVNDYVVIMNYLVNSSKDVEWETNVDGDDFTYAGLIDDLKAYCKSPWHNWKATLKQNYFNNPWASISVIAAVVLLTLTVIQTVFSIIK
ncbi:hypothetical protein Patl1_29642 [Pistacia atlantica]|uniref:Uncharacterized protein n=1 Tax=Pistacia atlantica TaxID=434234 RepID=A0ACC1AAJ6_9ROSI|nr:hypothetical protein Patl1_29642 [Pistacia atlantica]